MKSASKYTVSVVFLTLILIPLLLFGHDGPWLGPTKPSFRNPTSFPALRPNPSTFRQFNQWFVDRIGLRVLAIELGSGIHVGLLGRSTSPSVYLASNGWLFWDDTGKNALATLIDMRGGLRFSTEHVRDLDAALVKIHRQFGACGMVGILLVAPDKQSIYGEQIVAATARRETRLDDLLARLSPEAKSSIIDIRQDLLTQKERSLVPLYYRTDTHWNELGALVGARAIAERLAVDGISVDQQSYKSDAFVISTSKFQGDLSDRMLFSGDRFADEYFALSRRIPTNPVSSKMLFMGDSFGSALHNFLSMMTTDLVYVESTEIDL